ncbi:unnamed protein product [Linum trigynum]
MIIWVQLPAFPVHFYHKEVLFSLGNMIGRTIKLDYHTLHQQRARFARIAVEIDLAKPLVTRVRLDGAWQYLEYENLPVCCFECGKIGHTKETCPNLKPPSPPQLSLVVAGVSPSPSPETTTAPEEKSTFGPWMLVTRKSRRGNSTTRKGNSDSSNNDSGYQVKSGNGKATAREGYATAEISQGANRAGPQRAEGGNGGNKSDKDRGSMAGKKGKDGSEDGASMAGKKGKDGSEDGYGKERGKSILGPVPPKQHSNSPRPKNAPPKNNGPSGSGTKPIQLPSPRKVLFAGLDQTPSSPSLTTLPSAKGTTIQLVIPAQPKGSADQPVVESSPSASARTKGLKKQRKKNKSPGKASRPMAAKALQIWTPVKERKSKARSKMAALTLQEIEAWTGAANRAERVEVLESIPGDSTSAAKEKAIQPSSS